MRLPILYRASSGYLWRHPWQLALALLGICIGVAVMVAVDLANESSRKAFRLSLNAINGEATHHVVGGPEGLDESLYTRLRVNEGLRDIAPIIDGYIEINDTALRLIGVDLFAESRFRRYQLATRDNGAGGGPGPALVRRMLNQPGAILLSAATASRLGVRTNDRFSVLAAGRERRAVLADVLADGERGLGQLVIADIATAQAWLDKRGILSRIDVRIPPGDQAAVAERISAALPPGAQLLSADRRGRSVTELTDAFMTNLTAMSLLALLVGIFLIYNSVSFAVLQRRGLIGVLRALGLTRGQAFGLIITEGAILGVIGAVAGVLLGIWLGDQLLTLVSRSINDLYFRVKVSEVSVEPLSVAIGLAAGIGATIVAAAVPALEAASYRPRLAITRSVLEMRTSRVLPLIAAAGLLAVGSAFALLRLSSSSLNAGLTALFLLVLGFAVCIPVLVRGLSGQLAPLASRVAGMPARLAVSGVAASLSRTGVAIVALTVAVSTTVGVTVMVDSFRTAVSDWLGESLQSDIYVGVPYGSLQPALVDELAAVPGVIAYSARRWAWLESEQGRTRIIAQQMAPGRYAGVQLLDADAGQAWQEFDEQGAVFVSAPFAYRNQIGRGDNLQLLTGSGRRPFPVAATYQSYDAGGGSVLMSRATYLRHWADPRIDAIGLYLEPGADPATVVLALRQVSEGVQAIFVRSVSELRAASLRIFDRTFLITNVLYWLAVGVAVIGILGAMLALQLERARELAILRAIGMTPGQLAGMVTLQTGYIGLLSGLAALPLGLLLAWVLIDVINRRSFGWSMDIQVAGSALLSALALAVGAALLAGIYPAYRAARARPALAMREE